MHVKRLAVLGVLAAGFAAPAPEAEGRYERRRARRGEQTGTSAKLGAQAFINDREEGPRRLAAFVDAAGFRDALVPRLVPIRVGVSFRGRGEPIELRPAAFRLDSEALDSALIALNQEELLALPDGRAALEHAGRAFAVRHAPQPFGPDDGLRVPTRFHSDPARSVWVHDETRLPPGAWFTDLVFFRLPEDFDPWGPLLTLSLVDPSAPSEELVRVDFRVEEDTQLHRQAFRRAKKARKKEDKAARREAKRARKEERREHERGGGDVEPR